MKKKITLLVLAIAVMAALVLTGCGSSSVGTGKGETKNTENKDTISITVKIANDLIEPKCNEEEVVETSAKTLGEYVQSSDKFEYEINDFGTTIKAINGAQDGTNGIYWMFKVDGEDSMVGSDGVELKDGSVYEFYTMAY